MNTSIKELLYEGKAKKVYSTESPNILIVSYKDDATAFNGLKKESILGKGEINNKISNLLMNVLSKYNIPTHLICEINSTDSVVKKLNMFPLEIIVRNIAAGSISKKLGILEGKEFYNPILEFCYKKDELGDPMINQDHIFALNLATKEELDFISLYALKINTILSNYFKELGILLVDFKLEFGKDDKGSVILGDEISPDTCRFWDIKTRKKLDKDIFREDLGEDICKSYKVVLNKILSKE